MTFCHACLGGLNILIPLSHAACPALHCLQLKKGESLPPINVWLVDLATLRWSALPTSGDVPCARGGHTVSSCLR
jgi:hypothetical protein